MKKIIFVLSLVVFVLLTFIIYKAHFNLPYEYVGSFNIADDENVPLWFSVRDDKYYGFYDEKCLLKYCEDYNIGTIDTQKYTYIITCGHKLSSISYSFSEMKNRSFIIFPKQYIGKVLLEYEETDMVYIYRVKKIDIDCDYHNSSYNVFYKKSGDSK